MKQIILGAAVTLLMSVGAQAQWIYQETESAFSGAGTYMALTASGDVVFGLRCSDDTLDAVLIAQDRSIDSEALETFNSFSPQLMVRIDKNDVVKMSVTGFLLDNGNVRFDAGADGALAHQIRDARGSVSAAIEILGEFYYETKFNVRGSTAKVKKLLANCPTAQDGGSS